MAQIFCRCQNVSEEGQGGEEAERGCEKGGCSRLGDALILGVVRELRVFVIVVLGSEVGAWADVISPVVACLAV